MSKEFFDRRILEINNKIQKFKYRRKKIKIVYIVIILLSILTSTLSASIINIERIPHLVATILSMFSAVLTGISTRFNFAHKKDELDKLIKSHDEMRIKLDQLTTFESSPETSKKIIETLILMN